MITYNEMFVLNRALDGKNVYKVPSFSEINNKLETIAAAKDSLMEKGLMQARNALTAEGAKVVSRLEKYKKAKKYFNFQNVWSGVTPDGNAVTIIQSDRDKYELSYLKCDAIIDFITNKYKFISGKDSLFRHSTTIKSSELFKMYYIEAKEGFLAESVVNGKRICSYLYFEVKGKKYRYDNRTHKLVTATKKSITDDLRDMLTV